MSVCPGRRKKILFAQPSPEDHGTPASIAQNVSSDNKGADAKNDTLSMLSNRRQNRVRPATLENDGLGQSNEDEMRHDTKGPVVFDFG